MTDDNDYYEQTPEEIQAHFGPGGPVAPATAFLEFVLRDRNYAKAWLLMDPAYRAARAKAWIEANARHVTIRGRDHTMLAAELAKAPSTSKFWSAFAETELRLFSEAWPNVDLDNWGWASRPRPHGPDQEVVLFTPDGVGERVAKSTLVRGLQLVMQHSEHGWLVAGPLDDAGELCVA